MPDFSAQDVQRLRQRAGVGMMDAKSALSEAEGDFDRAFELLRERGVADAARRSDRQASEGAIGSYLHQQADRVVAGVIVELSSETDFVAKSEEFRRTADDIAMHVAWGKPEWLARDDVPAEELAREAEIITKQAENEGKPDNVIPKIVEGRLQRFYEEHVLLDQVFVNPDRFEGTVGDMMQQLAARMEENISVRRFARLAIGEN